MGFDVFRGSEGFIGRWDCFDHTLLEINQIYINEKEIWREKEITQDSETRYIYRWLLALSWLFILLHNPHSLHKSKHICLFLSKTRIKLLVLLISVKKKKN